MHVFSYYLFAQVSTAFALVLFWVIIIHSLGYSLNTSFGALSYPRGPAGISGSVPSEPHAVSRSSSRAWGAGHVLMSDSHSAAWEHQERHVGDTEELGSVLWRRIEAAPGFTIPLTGRESLGKTHWTLVSSSINGV